jgi:hypothetical protein
VALARTVHRTLIRGADRAGVERLAGNLLANDLVEAVSIVRPDEVAPAIDFYRHLIGLPAEAPPRISSVPIRDADDAELGAVSRAGVLSLDLDELHAIQRYYRDLGREPTDGELETIAQTWSEHCSHKTFKARIHYREAHPAGVTPAGHPMLAELSHGDTTLDGLLKTYLVAATERVKPSWLLSAFVDNAGIVAFGEDDFAGQSLQRAQELLAASRVDKLSVLVRSHHPDLDDLRTLAEKNKGRLEVLTEPSELGTRLPRAHFALTCGDGLALEMACVGVPQMTITQNPRHVPNAKKLDEEGVATYLGTAEEVTVNTLRDAVNYVLDDQLERVGMSRCARLMVDGRGQDRIVNGLEILIHAPAEPARLRLVA